MPAHWFSRLCLACGMLFAPTILMSSSADPDLMPLPMSLQRETGVFRLTPGFRVGFATGQDDRLTRAVSRTLRAWEERSGLEFSRNSSGDYLPAANVASAGLVVECAKDAAEFPQLGEDESYTLIVTPEQVRLRAATGRGVLHGLATLQQWLQGDDSGWHLPAVTIGMTPVFAYITFSQDVLYPTYEYAPRITELTAAADQLLAGSMMKLGGMSVMMLAFGISFYRWYQADAKKTGGPKSAR